MFPRFFPEQAYDGRLVTKWRGLPLNPTKIGDALVVAQHDIVNLSLQPIEVSRCGTIPRLICGSWEPEL